ncbi:hypothetical protein GWI33_016122 [Rhynchophorus ferrugineus]|uniref:Uncharacterized protein n=1 Tax=Rhynchophorus ferrugineus TaxID=354439 RepID=A0A834MAN1_RHYFE|nr:hypothetical protein GWI33_016122 [Rhynchophorus ferrugineus]
MMTKNFPRTIVTTTSQLQTNSQTSSTTTRVKSSSSSTTTSTQRVHLSSSSDLKASNMKSDLVDLKNNLNDMKTSLSNYDLPVNIKKLKSSLENLVSTCYRYPTPPKDVDHDGEDLEADSQPLVTFPDDSRAPSEVASPQPNNAVESLKFEQKTTNKKTKVIKDGLTAEKESTKVAEMKKIQAGDLTYEENKAAAATTARLEIDGISAQKSQIKAKDLVPHVVSGTSLNILA